MTKIPYRLLFAVLLLLCLDVRGQVVSDDPAPEQNSAARRDGQQQPKPPAQPQGSVAGRVILGDLRGPARGARVMLLPSEAKGRAGIANGSQMALTGLDGTFLIEHVAAGEYFVIAFAAGYLSPLDGIQIQVENGQSQDTTTMEKQLRENATVVRVQGPQRARAEVELRRGAILSGRVTYADGLPASQLSVAMERTDLAPPENGKGTVDAGILFRSFILAQRYATDDEGRFRIAGLAPGTYRVAVPQASGTGNPQMEVFGSFAQSGGAHQLTFYSGNTLHPKAAKAYKLAAGETIEGVDITLPLSGLHAVAGVLASKDGQPINYAAVSLEDAADPAISFRVMVNAASEFRFTNVPEGTYTLKVGTAGFVDNPGLAEVPPEMMDRMEQMKRSRAYADQTMPVIVLTTDVENLAMTLTETKLPVIPKQQKQDTPSALDED